MSSAEVNCVRRMFTDCFLDVCACEGTYRDFIDIIRVVYRLTEVAVPGCSGG